MPHDQLGRFREQVEFLSRHYRLIGFEAFDRIVCGHTKLQGGNVLLTFDDGFASHRAVAEEVLNPSGIRAMFFVLPDFISCGGRVDQKHFIASRLRGGRFPLNQVADEVGPMSWSDLESLARAGHEIGSHTLSHRRLSTTTDAREIHREVVLSGDILEKRLKRPARAFAFPFGDVDSMHVQAFAVALHRYRYLFSCVRGANRRGTSRGAIRREAVHLTDSNEYLRFIVEGGLSVYYRRARTKLDRMAKTVESATRVRHPGGVAEAFPTLRPRW